ncbi:MAG: hypothetical protein P8Y38_07345 [Deltaproteobacteria bacterium]
MQTLMKFMIRMERLMVAAAFAEAGCFDTARWVMDEEKRTLQQRRWSRAKVQADQRPSLRL